MSAITSTPVPAGTRWSVDPVHSNVGFSIKHMVVSTFRGRFEDYDATLTAQDDGSLRLEGSVRADSIVVKDDNLAAHLASPDFFDTENHPQITFASTLVRSEGGELIVEGELTIKDHTHPLEARGTISDPIEIPGHFTKLGIVLEAVIDRTQYGLEWNSALPNGGFALSNEVKLVAELEFTQA